MENVSTSISFNDLVKRQSKIGVKINEKAYVEVFNMTNRILDTSPLREVKDFWGFIITNLPSLVTCFYNSEGVLCPDAQHSLYAYFVSRNSRNIPEREKAIAQQLAMYLGMHSVREQMFLCFKSYINEKTLTLEKTKMTGTKVHLPEYRFITSQLMGYLAMPSNGRRLAYMSLSTPYATQAFYQELIRKPMPDLKNSIFLRGLSCREDFVFVPSVFEGVFGRAMTPKFAEILGLYQNNSSVLKPGGRGNPPKYENLFPERILPHLKARIEALAQKFYEIKAEYNISDDLADIYYVSPYFISFYIDRSCVKFFKALPKGAQSAFSPWLYLEGYFPHPF